MEFSPRYPQPFTIVQAIGFDVSVIIEEIARLQNSVAHLKGTQQAIRTHLDTEGKDEDLTAALMENEQVIASQQERISMLQFALREKGIIETGHYSVAALSIESPQGSQVEQPIMADHGGDEDGGIDL